MLLSICIPTCNRPEYIEQLFVFLSKEVGNLCLLQDKIEIIIGDNSTNLLSSEIFYNSALVKNNNVYYVKNGKNLGLIGNIVNLSFLAKGEYIWFMGDDDIYYDNLLSIVINTLLEDEYSFVFLNHRICKNGKEENSIESVVDLSKPEIYMDGKLMLIYLWNFSTTSTMFISACIYKTNYVIESINYPIKKDLAFPLFMSFYCGSKGKTKIIKEVCIDNLQNEISWASSVNDVFFSFIPNILFKLPDIGYGYIKSKIIVLNFLRPIIKDVIIYNIKKCIKNLFIFYAR